MAKTFNDTEIRINYTVDGIAHSMTLGCQLGQSWTIGSDPLLSTKGGTDILASTCVDNFMTVVIPLYASDATFSNFEVWNYDAGVTDWTFVYSDSIALAGTSGATNKGAWQASYMYRATTGKVGRVIMLESISGVYASDSRPFGTLNETVATFLEGSTSWIYHSSGGFVSSVYKFSVTTNNALERRRYGVS